MSDQDRSTGQDNQPGSQDLPRRRLLKSTGILAGLGSVGLSHAATHRNSDPNEEPPSCPGNEPESSPPPGPWMLHASSASAQQLENTGSWQAEPLMVSGTDAYVDGEYLFQDFIYDDYGANTTKAVSSTPPDPKNNENDDFSPPTGDLSYPTATEIYRHNAADLLEFRVQPVGDSLTYRITLNTMVKPDVAGIAIGINTDRDSSTGTNEWGYGIGSLGDLGMDHRLVTWGTGAELDGTSVPSSVDTSRNQIEVTVPLQPGDETWRHYLVVGVFDSEATRFKQVQARPDERNPGGGNGDNPPPIFNIGFRFADQEPMGLPNARTENVEREGDHAMEERSGSRGFGYGHWREHAQANALATRDITQFYADINFQTLSHNVREINVPETGYLNRLYASHFDLGEGFDDNENILRGRIQPYSIYIPEAYDPDLPTAFHLHLHANRSSYNEVGVFMPRLLRQLGEQRDAVILTPEARGPGRFYHDTGEFSVFEAWADASRHYNLDFDRVTIDGYSTGGYGTIKFASQYPDLFAKAFSTVGFAGAIEPLMTTWESAYNIHTEIQDVAQLRPNLRHLPLLMWNGGNDEIVQPPEPLAYEQQLRDLGYRHELDLFTGYDHLTFLYRDHWGPAQDFLDSDDVGSPQVTRHPPRVTYRVVPDLDAREYGLVHDAAYWVSDIKTASDVTSGLVDAHSKAIEEQTPLQANYRRPGSEPDPHIKRGTRWEDQLVTSPRENEVEIDLNGVSGVTLWVEEAHIDPTAPVHLTIDTTHSVQITLAGSFGDEVVDVAPGHTEMTVRLGPSRS